MHHAARPILLFTTLAMVSFALGAATARLSAGPVPVSEAVQPLPVSHADPSVPPASQVKFPADADAGAPTF